MPMALVLALQNLFRDPVRFLVTLTGIVVAVILIVIQLGLFVGFARTTSSLVDHANADIWIAAKGSRNVDQSGVVHERRRFQALGVSGVASAETYVTHFAVWDKPGGGSEVVVVVGFDPDSGTSGPWNVVAGTIGDLKSPGSVLIDELYAEKLGIGRIGQIAELNGRRARVVGFTRGIRSFTQSPYVFASLKSAQTFAGLHDNEYKYVLVRTKSDVDLGAVRRALAARMSDVEVLSQDEFSRRTRFYWMFTTGAGLALLVAAVIGLAVGSVIVAQTLYAATIDHLREFATLRAMGAPNRYLNRIVLTQAMTAAAIGYVIGISFGIGIASSTRLWGPRIDLPWELGLVVAALTVAMCGSAAVISIRKIKGLDPATVFK